MRHLVARLLSRTPRQDTTQPFASGLSSSPHAPYLPELLKSDRFQLCTPSPKHRAQHGRVAQSIVVRGRGVSVTCSDLCHRMVELIGIEPTTPCLQSRCSPKLSYSPVARSQKSEDRSQQERAVMCGAPHFCPLSSEVVGLDGFEPSTPALSRRCSNQLSYRPLARFASLQPIGCGH